MIVWAMNEGQTKGLKVDQPLLAELTKWIAESGDGRTTAEKPADAPKTLNSKALWFSLALASVPKPDEAARNGQAHLLETLRLDQTASGSWNSWPDSRLPILGKSDFAVTALAALALTSAPQDDTASKQTREQAVKWLDSATPDDELQSLTMQLTLSSRLKSSVEQKQPLIEKLIARQNSDSGWSQTKEMASDAWASGQALYALSLAGLDSKHDSIARGKKFLVQSQREDGSWPMISRPSKPGGAGATNLVPITGAGSAWAVIGLSSSQ
jgi:hypothetical protein